MSAIWAQTVANKHLTDLPVDPKWFADFFQQFQLAQQEDAWRL